MKLENVCLDIDVCGKTALETACGISKSLKRFEQYIPAKCICITGDVGGGGAVQTIFPILVDSGALSAWAKLKTQKKKVQQTKDAARVIGFADHMNEFDDKVTKMKRSANYDTKVTAIIEDMNMKSSGTKRDTKRDRET